MKVKQTPDDFRVEELSDVTPGQRGEFALYRLDKTGWTTLDALGKLRRAWQLEAGRVGYGGLKDRHAVTSQFVTIYRGPPKSLRQDRVAFEYLGQVPTAFTSHDIKANRFTLTLRHLTADGVAYARAALREAGDTGVPNYFDDQRFGSVGRGNRFVGREMVRGDFEAALKLALAEPYEHDRAPAKAEKATLRELWGRWDECKAALPKGHARSLIDYLRVHPADFAGAVARLRPELGSLYLAAYQSYLWNRTLDHWLRARLPAEAIGELNLSVGRFAVPKAMPAELMREWHALDLPLPSARLKVSTPEIDAVLTDEGLTLPGLRVRKMERPYFSKGSRSACLRVTASEPAEAADDLNAGRRKLTLAFELPRGCYATMVVKRLTG